MTGARSFQSGFMVAIGGSFLSLPQFFSCFSRKIPTLVAKTATRMGHPRRCGTPRSGARKGSAAPTGLVESFHRHPRLTPWAAFLRRFAANCMDAACPALSAVERTAGCLQSGFMVAIRDSFFSLLQFFGFSRENPILVAKGATRMGHPRQFR